jgi:uncharacterized membrane protein
MKTEQEINKILETVQQATASTIVFNEQGILNEYKNQEDNQSSIAIKILSIVGGFIATLAFLGFLLLAGLNNSEIGLLLTGIFFIAISIILNRKSDKLIMDTFSISTYIIGVFLIVFGLGEMHVDENIVAILIMIIAISSLILTQNYILSFISILVISSSLLMLLVFLNNTPKMIHLYSILITLAMTYVFLYEAQIITWSKKLSRLYNPLRIGLIISFIFSLGYFGTKKIHGMPADFEWFFSLILFVILVYVISKILEVLKITSINTKIVVYVLSSIILVVTAFSPAILGSILLILLSFYVNYKFGLALGIIALIYFVGQYYYDLHFTLLTKSIMLFISGLLFIALYLFTTKSITNEKV